MIEQEAKPIAIATEEQVAEVRRLLDTVKLPEGTVEKWLNAAGATDFSEMEEDKILKVIASLKAKLAA